MHSIDAPTRPEAGFTLIEVAIAMLVLGVLALSVGATMVTNFRTADLVDQQGVAREATRSKVEEILAWPTFETTADQFDGETFDVAPLARINGALPGTVVIDDTDPTLLVIVVRVDWLGPWGDEGYEVRTMRTNTSE